MNRNLYWIWLRLVLQGNINHMYSVYTAIADIETVFRGSYDDYKKHSIPSDCISALLDKDLTAAYNIWGQCEKFGINILTIEDDAYPQNLREIAVPPCMLFYMGDLLSCLNTPLITVVGTRHSSASGDAIASKFGEDFANIGVTIVCGVAQGIDEAICKSVVKADGRCIMMLPCGILAVPDRVRYLMKNAVTHGAVVSEWLPHEPTTNDSYLIRNRLLSALSYGTLVLQSPKKSGAQMTANYALSQGKEVFSIPGGVLDPSFAGNNLLLQDGAVIVLEAMDVVNYYRRQFGDAISDIVIEDDEFEQFVRSVSQTVEFENEEQEIVYNSIEEAGSTIDEIVIKSDLQTHIVLSQLTLMEINGWVKSIPGGKYKIIT